MDSLESSPMRLRLMTLVLALGLSHPAIGVGPETSGLDFDPKYRDAVRLIKREDYKAALPLLHQLDVAYPKTPDVLNWIGYANRKLKDYPTSKRFYDAALAINPEYRPALEYQGMWFIEMGDIPAAKANLAKLIKLCEPCEETGDLREALKKAGH
jgi:tetratricopeptide (TPR) repeat protein